MLKKKRGRPKKTETPEVKVGRDLAKDRDVMTAADVESDRSDMHYYWERNSQRAVVRAQQKGAVMVKPDEVDVREGLKHQDGFVSKGDLILMKRSREDVEREEKELKMRTQRIPEAVQEKIDRENAIERDEDKHYQVSRGRRYFIP